MNDHHNRESAEPKDAPSDKPPITKKASQASPSSPRSLADRFLSALEVELIRGVGRRHGLGVDARCQTSVSLRAKTPAISSSDTTDLARYRLCSLGRLADVVHDDERTAAVMWIGRAAPVGAANVCLYEHAMSFARLSSVSITFPLQLTCVSLSLLPVCSSIEKGITGT